MRYLTTIFAAVLCIVFAFGIVAAQEASPGAFAVTAMGGAAAGDITSDSLGYGGGVKVTLSNHVGVVGFYDYMPMNFLDAEGDKVYGSNMSMYATVTLFDFKRINFGGLVGLEWGTAKFADFLDDSPAMAVGVMGIVKVANKVGVYAVFTTPTDYLDDLDNFRTRLGMTFTVF